MGGQANGIVSDILTGKIYASSRLNAEGFVMSAPHCHPYFELFYVESGACSFFIENNMYDLHEGDFLLIPPERFHYTRYLMGDCRRGNIFFKPEHLFPATAKVLPSGENFFAETRIFTAPEGFRGHICGHIARMAREYKLVDDCSASLMEALFNELMLLCARECNFLDTLPRDIHTTDAPIVRAAQFMEAHYMDDIAMADIAAAAGYSPNYLSRRFREAAGIGVHEYLVFIRLQRAALELVSTDSRITDIATRCGFSDGNYFKDAFKRKYGVTPREYRKA